jgi:DNA repair exonuclease SbcCD nuclease subunit
MILGDLTDGHKEPAQQQEQWNSFLELFPEKGVEFDGQAVPAFACAGNHDGAPNDPLRRGLVARNRRFAEAGRLADISSNGVHFALNFDGVHFLSLNLCPADTTDAETPFKYGQPGPGSWNDPEGALTFLKHYLAQKVAQSGEPVILMFHYGFDGFSMNDWNWWTARQRRELYQALQGYNVAALLHGHDHHAERYRWPDPKRHAAELPVYFGGKPPEHFPQYDVISCGSTCWVLQVRGDQLVAAHFKGPDWSNDPNRVYIKSLKAPATSSK